MAGLYRGGRDYDLRFVELADFARLRRRRRGGCRRARRGDPRRDAALRRDARSAVPRGALQLVQLLRLLGRCRDADLRRARRPERRRFVAATIAALGLAAALALAPRAAQAAGVRPRRADDAARPRQVGRGDLRRDAARSRCSTARCESSGRLSFKAPDSFVRETLKPRHEKLAVDGNTLTMSLGERSRTMQLDASPEAAVIVEAIRGTLTGNRAALERLFETTVSGDAERWSLEARAARPAPARPGRRRCRSRAARRWCARSRSCSPTATAR